MQRISVNLTNDCDENQLNYNNDLPAIKNKNYALQKPFETDFFTIIGNPKLRPSFDLHSHIFFGCEIICKNYFIVKSVILS